VTITNSTIQFTTYPAIHTGQIGFDSTSGSYGRPDLSIVGSTLSGGAAGPSVRMASGGTLRIANSVVASPGPQPALELANAAPYALTATGTTFATGTGGTAIVLQGDAASTFDLGSVASDGGNVVGVAAAATGLRVSVAAGVAVDAIGNTWKANVQGADANGRYSVALCGGTTPCAVTSGSGGNFVFQDSGAGAALRLAK
jgi:hypothetical protein